MCASIFSSRPVTPMANAIRALSMDAVENARSGHPGMPMGMAEIAVALWAGHLKHNPANPAWPNRDRFVLSNGHGSMLLYSLLHLTGYDLGTDDLRAFRTLGSRTPGHPEHGYTPGVETTTGPLGQGLANAVGMALAEKLLAERYNRPGHEIIDHFTYVFAGDGCLMEGISHEVCGLAGTLGLGKLVVLYDDNSISIDGDVRGWFAEDTTRRFEAYGWDVISVDGHDVEAVSAAIETARADRSRPTLIRCRTTIGKGSPNLAGSEDSHGSPLGAAEIAATRAAIDWPYAPFEVPQDIKAAWDARAAGEGLEREWSARLDQYRASFPDLAAEMERRLEGRLPDEFEAVAEAAIRSAVEGRQNIASRKASEAAITALAAILPEIVGGSADLSSSNGTLWKGARPVEPGKGGDYIYYGVREFGMAAIMNGLAVHGGFRPFGGTYLTFSDYARNAIRMAALMRLNPVFVLTHDSIALGQDGPTHQPVEHLASLRDIPGLDLWRPCDAVETAVAWQTTLRQGDRPVVLALSRQNLPHQQRSEEQLACIARGGYVLCDSEGKPSLVIIATGSEVELAVEAAGRLAEEGVAVRVVSMPSTTIFERQDAVYRESVLPSGVARLSVEAGTTRFWRSYVGLEGATVGIDRFGESAAPDVLFDHFGITASAVFNEAKVLLALS